jgi:hypothetical protein
MASERQEYVDITAPEHGVQITVRENELGNVIWVNVDGLCVARVCQVSYLEVNLPDQELIVYGELEEEES